MSTLKVNKISGPDGKKAAALNKQWSADSIAVYGQLGSNLFNYGRNFSSFSDEGTGQATLQFQNPYVDIYYSALGNAAKDDDNNDGNMKMQASGNTTTLRTTFTDNVITAYYIASSLVRDTDLVQYQSVGTLA